MIRPVTYEGQI